MKQTFRKISIFILLSLCLIDITLSQKQIALPVFINNSGKLEYTPDEKGNQIPDYSYCGYKSGNQEIPNVPVIVFVLYRDGDETQRIQSAIDYVSSLPLNSDGFRGTILLDKGNFKLEGRLKISSSGIVIRGSGTGENGTTLIAAGYDRETLIKIVGDATFSKTPEVQITDEYVPVNSMVISVKEAGNFKIGDEIIIRRPFTKEWISELKMTEFGGETEWLGWKPGEENLVWDRIITDIKGNQLFLNAPITTSLDVKYGSGFISSYSWPGRIENIGIENLNCISEYDLSNPKDEDHCWMAITIENASDCWIRQINFENFAGSAVAAYETAKQITVEDCISLNPVSEIAGQRRYTFFTNGQQILFQRCYSEYGYHDFSAGYCASGPNAFVQCESHLPYSFSGTIDRWASGVLFDNVNIDGDAISFKNREADGQGAGWTAANSMIWQCYASKIECYSPPTATNWAFGDWGQFAGNAYWYEPNSHINPRSLFYAQLASRKDTSILKRAQFIPREFESTSSPTIQQAADWTNQSKQAKIQMLEWIKKAGIRNPIPVVAGTAKSIDQIDAKQNKKITKALPAHPVSIKNGWLVTDNAVITGSIADINWWRGTARPSFTPKAMPHITRFVPGRTGTGLTDDLNQVVENMKQNHTLAIEHHYGLWYERRCDDHEFVRRINSDVWPPFYEQPFARSGKDFAWDGLSKYDLTKPNKWYWMRLKQFADLADQNGLILIHQNYFQHNIIEAAAHYATFSWRTANNINNTGFPEPPPYAGDKRIFMAEQLYDLSDSVRRELHKGYIHQCMNNFADNHNVVQLIGAEFTGPLHFTQFWIDEIQSWEKETGKNEIIGLSTTKDVQDAILEDPSRSKTIDLIDIHYWTYRADSSIFAPEGGKSLAPRQQERLEAPGKYSFSSIYRAVSEYRLKYPEKAVIYSRPIDNHLHWAVFMAGGSMANIPEIEEPGFEAAAASMLPQKYTGTYVLKNNPGEQIIYLTSKNKSAIDFTSLKGSFQGIWIDPQTGKTLKKDKAINAGKSIEIISPFDEAVILWLKKE